MKTLKHKFVEIIPEPLEEGTLYISIEHTTTMHLCVCGCGNKVVTSISPNTWKLIFDGETISLYPSIGSWNLACKSHYFIRNSEIIIVPDKHEIKDKSKKRRKKSSNKTLP